MHKIAGLFHKNQGHIHNLKKFSCYRAEKYTQGCAERFSPGFLVENNYHQYGVSAKKG